MSDYDDAALLDELAAVLAGETEPPPDVLHAARESYTWRTVDAELAVLVFDSAVDGELVTTRSAAEGRTVTFESPTLTIDVDVAAGLALLGQLDPPQAAAVELRGGGGTVAAEADDLGRFTVAVPESWRIVRLRCTLADGTTVESGALVL